jgi:cobalamin biosynthesis protein CobD/CbiB
MKDKKIIERLAEQVREQHEANKKRIRYGFITMILSPFILYFVMWFTESDKVAFIIVWALVMFIISIYLLHVAYRDSLVDRTYSDLTDEKPQEKEDES